MNNEEEVIKCKVKLNRQFFPKNNEEICNGDFAILSVNITEQIEGTPQMSKWNTITIKGNVCEIDNDKEYMIVATEENTDYGVQYNLIYFSEYVELTTVSDQKKFLSQILTEKQLENIFEVFDNPIEIINNEDVDKLCSVKGIGETVAENIIEKYNESKDYSKAYIELYDLGLSKNMMDKLIEAYGSTDILIDKIKNNIYIIADEVNGIGFKKADEIALKKGMKSNDIRRIKAFIKYFLNDNGKNGKSYILYKELLIAVQENLKGINKKLFGTAMTELKKSNIIWWNDSKTKIALMKYKKLEESIFNEIVRLKSQNNKDKFKYDNWLEIVQKQEKKQGWEYTEEQKKGIKTILDNNITLVTGLAGTGKSTIVNAVAEILRLYKIIQCALAGRAAQRMNEISGLESNTIHKTLGFIPKKGFTYNSKNPLLTDVIIIDESSMIGGDLFLNLLKAISNNTKVVILGDHGQLDSIGACNVFYDLLHSNAIPIVKLTTIHRQAKASAIISKSIDIRNKKQLFDKDFEGKTILGQLQDLELDITLDKTIIQHKIIEHFKNKLEMVDDIMDLQVIVPMKTRGKICTYELNNKMQNIYNNLKSKSFIEIKYAKDKIYKIGVNDKVINIENNYKTRDMNGERVDIFNGDIGKVIKINKRKKYIIVRFNSRGDIKIKGKALKGIELAYAITVHKLQGSSAKVCIVGIDYSAFKLLTAELLYTAITRAEDLCALVGENGAIRYAISHISVNNKRTFLKEMLKENTITI
ncbi:AAA family ATPase [Clostridium sp. CTA-6]